MVGARGGARRTRQASAELAVTVSRRFPGSPEEKTHLTSDARKTMEAGAGAGKVAPASVNSAKLAVAGSFARTRAALAAWVVTRTALQTAVDPEKPVIVRGRAAPEEQGIGQRPASSFQAAAVPGIAQPGRNPVPNRVPRVHLLSSRTAHSVHARAPSRGAMG